MGRIIKTNYKSKLKALLTRVINSIELISEPQTKITLPKKLSKSKLLANKLVIDQIKLAKQFLDDDDLISASNLICSIPATIIDPNPCIATDNHFIGSDRVYSIMGTARYYCRMISIDKNLNCTTIALSRNHFI